MTGLTFLVLLAATLGAYFLNRSAARGLKTAGGGVLHSLPTFHGLYAALLVALPVLALIMVFLVFKGVLIDRMVLSAVPPEALATAGSDLILSEVRSLSRGQSFGEAAAWKTAAAEHMARLESRAGLILPVLTVLGALGGFLFARRKLGLHFRARQGVESILYGIMLTCALLAVMVTLGIILSLVFESYRFFQMVPFHEFLFGLNWEPQIPMRADQIAGAGAFGWIPVLTGTLLITTIALVIAVPVGLFAAIYLNEFATPRIRKVAKPVLEVLAGVPTVVYGFFAILTVAPALREAGAALGLPVSPNTALAAGGVMAIMLVPFISSFADDALTAVPRSLRDGSLALGATRGETMMKVQFPAAIPGIVGGVLLAVSRAIGETMIVVMAAGLIAKLTFNPLESVTTVTVQIVTLLIGDSEFDSPKTLAAFALGLMLFLLTLIINLFALGIVRKYRELYD